MTVNLSDGLRVINSGAGHGSGQDFGVTLGVTTIPGGEIYVTYPERSMVWKVDLSNGKRSPLKLKMGESGTAEGGTVGIGTDKLGNLLVTGAKFKSLFCIDLTPQTLTLASGASFGDGPLSRGPGRPL